MRELEFSDEVRADILKSVEEWGDECRKQSAFEALPKYVRKEFDFITTSFSEMMYGYHLQSPEHWTAAALEEVLVDVFPRKMMLPEAFFKTVEPSLTFFVESLRQTGVLNDRKALALTKGIKKAVPVMRRRANDFANLPSMEQLLLEGDIEQSVDVTDVDALYSVPKGTSSTNRLSEDSSRAPAPSKKIGRNEPCPCGSGKKYKKCCGSGASKEPPHVATSNKSEEEGKSPSLEQWAQLYEVADNLKKLAPWGLLWDSDLITILLPGRDEPVYCSVMGGNGECYAIGVYPGYESIWGYHLYLRKGEIEVDFDGGETLLRFYSPEKELWLNTATKALPIPVSPPVLIVSDELLIARLKKQKKSRVQLEFDLLYFPTPIQEHKDDTPYLPRMVMLADRKSGRLLNQHMSPPDEDIENVVLDMLCDHIMNRGRPAAIYVRNMQTRLFLEDICEKIGVKLIDDEGVPALNEMLEKLLESLV